MSTETNRSASAASHVPETLSGTFWIRVALQVNPFAYKGRSAPANSYTSEDDYNTALLDQCEALDIRMIAITDHWSVETADGLIKSACQRGIVALPGFEANSSEGVHILVIFDASTSAAEINAAIGICGATPGASGAGECSYSDIVEKMTHRGAVVIPAHVNVSPSGMLSRVSGQPLEKMVVNGDVHVIGVTPSADEATNQEAIVANRKPFNRSHPLAIIHADDVMKPSDLEKSGSTSWLKVSSACLESLKLAVRTPATRVSLTDPAATPRALIRSVSWTGGFLDNVELPISGELSALIGGRGTGKSTVIESLRFALGIDPIGKESTAEHKAIVKEVLKSGTIVRVQVETPYPTPRRYTIERAVNEPPVVKDSSGAPTKQRPADILPKVEVFGQHELAELANDPARVAKMLQRFTGSDGPDHAHQKTLSELEKNRFDLGEAEILLANLDDELSEIPRLEEQIRQYDSTDVPTKLVNQQRIGQDEAVLTETTARVSEVRKRLRPLTDSQVDGDLTATYDSCADSPQKEYLEKATAAAAELGKFIAEISSQVRLALSAAEASIKEAKGEWDAAVGDQRTEYNEALRLLHEQGLEPDKYVDTKSALEKVKAKKPRREKLLGTLADLKRQRKAHLVELQGHEERLAEKLREAVRLANNSTGGVVMVQPMPAPERSHITSVLESHVSGVRNNITAAINAEDFSPRSFVAAARSGFEELAKYGIKGAQANTLTNAGEPLLRELEELSVGLAVDVKLDVAYGLKARQYKSLRQLSKGQKATALLLLLLSGSDAPLIIDQPEDDLDNRFVYDGVVTNLRNLKGKRQVITSTHNANVPVLGDAELIIALEGDGQHGWPTEGGIGSLDDKNIRSLAENILEGGPDAFNARQHLYGF